MSAVSGRHVDRPSDRPGGAEKRDAGRRELQVSERHIRCGLRGQTAIWRLLLVCFTFHPRPFCLTCVSLAGGRSTCPAWRNQKHSVNVRSCKHLVQHLGAEFEAQRCPHLAAAAKNRRQGTKRKTPARSTVKQSRARQQDHIAAAASPDTKQGNVAAVVPSSAREDDEDDDDDDKVVKTGKRVVSVLLAEKWSEAMDPVGWMLSEKLDGVRAYWADGRFWSRLGNAFEAPPFFTAALPNNVTLDGELWLGRGKFQATVAIVRSHLNDDIAESWRALTFQCFDAPSIDKPFEARLADVTSLASAAASPFFKVVQHRPCTSRQQLAAFLVAIEKAGGEGAMMRMAGSAYVGKRSRTLLKIKSFHDAEFNVLGYAPGKGRHKGVVGALECKTAAGHAFRVGTGLSDADRADPPPIGAKITVRYQELTDAGIPRFPSYVGLAIDK